MDEARLFGGGVGMPGNHRLVPLVNLFGRVLRSIFLYPLQNRGVIIEFVGNLFECVSIDFEKRQQMFIEADGFVIVAVEQSFPMQSGFVD
jgi:hypothetical protein